MLRPFLFSPPATNEGAYGVSAKAGGGRTAVGGALSSCFRKASPSTSVCAARRTDEGCT